MTFCNVYEHTANLINVDAHNAASKPVAIWGGMIGALSDLDPFLHAEWQDRAGIPEEAEAGQSLYYVIVNGSEASGWWNAWCAQEAVRQAEERFGVRCWVDHDRTERRRMAEEGCYYNATKWGC